MAVGVKGHADGAMPEPLLHDFGVHTLPEHKHRRVAPIVEVNERQPQAKHEVRYIEQSW